MSKVDRIASATAVADSVPIETCDGYVYIIECQGFYKIGRAIDPEKRVKSLIRTIMPFDFNLYFKVPCHNSARTERFLHHEFRACHVRGEWYRLSDEELAQVKDLLVRAARDQVAGARPVDCIAMTGTELKRRRKELTLSQDQFARALGVAYGTVTRWEQFKDKDIIGSGMLPLALEALEARHAHKQQ